MDNAFLIKLALSFVVGGTYIALTIWASEKYGSKLGGLLAGLPSTLLVSIAFIAWTQGLQTTLQAIPIIPAAIAANTLFLVVFIALHKNELIKPFVLGLMTWFILSLILVLLQLQNILISVILAIIFYIISIQYLKRFPHKKLSQVTTTKFEFLSRAVAGGSVVALAVLLSNLLGPIWGGAFASFPAVFATTMFFITKRHGIEFMSSVARTMPYGNVSSALFAVALYFLAIQYGIIAGIILAYMVSLLYAVVMYKFVLARKNEKVSQN